MLTDCIDVCAAPAATAQEASSLSVEMLANMHGSLLEMLAACASDQPCITKMLVGPGAADNGRAMADASGQIECATGEGLRLRSWSGRRVGGMFEGFITERDGIRRSRVTYIDGQIVDVATGRTGPGDAGPLTRSHRIFEAALAVLADLDDDANCANGRLAKETERNTHQKLVACVFEGTRVDVDGGHVRSLAQRRGQARDCLLRCVHGSSNCKHDADHVSSSTGVAGARR